MSKEFSNPDPDNIEMPNLNFQLGAFESDPISFVNEPLENEDSPKGFVGGFFEVAHEDVAPYRAEEVGWKMAEIESTLDYSKIAKDMLNDEMDDLAPGKISRIFGASELVKRDEIGPTDLESMGRHIDKVSSDLEALGYINPEVEAQSEKEVDEALLDRVRDNRAARILSEKYKSKYLAKPDSMAVEMLDRIDNQAESEFTIEDWRVSGRFYNQPLTQAIKREVAEKAKELPAFDYELSVKSEAYQEMVTEARSINPDEAIKDLIIEGQFEEYCFLSAEGIKADLKRKIPPIATKNIHSIHLVETLGQKDDIVTEGLTIFSDSGSSILISKHGAQQDLEFYEDDPQHEQIVGFLRRQVLYHESAHQLHESLPAAALNMWSEAVESEPVNITDYVERMNSEVHPNRHKEDFADSVSTYLTNAKKLRDQSPARFEALTRIYNDFMPNFEEDLWRSIFYQVSRGEAE